jgi:hypothetical protein
MIVDVGGGIGSTSAVLARNFPDLRIVVQDRPAIIEDAKKVMFRMLGADLDHASHPRSIGRKRIRSRSRQVLCFSKVRLYVITKLQVS